MKGRPARTFGGWYRACPYRVSIGFLPQGPTQSHSSTHHPTAVRPQQDVYRSHQTAVKRVASCGAVCAMRRCNARWCCERVPHVLFWADSRGLGIFGPFIYIYIYTCMSILFITVNFMSNALISFVFWIHSPIIYDLFRKSLLMAALSRKMTLRRLCQYYPHQV